MCYSTECPGVYGGQCHKDDDASRCPCGCWLMVNLNNQIRYAYEMEEAEATGVLFFNGDPLEGELIRSINNVGTIISLLHGEMMEHAAGG